LITSFSKFAPAGDEPAGQPESPRISGEKTSLLILGTHYLAEELADWLDELPEFQLVGFVENFARERCEMRIADQPVYWLEDLPDGAFGCQAVCALGTTHRAQFIEQALARGIAFAKFLHPAARVSRSTTLGEGTILSPGVIVASHTQLGRHVFVNRGALVGHHAVVEDYVSIMPGANIAGLCHIETGAYIGMGAIVRDRVRIGAHAVVGAGAVVVSDVPPHTQVQGVPAKIVKENIAGK